MSKKLRLNRESLHALNRGEDQVVGGQIADSKRNPLDCWVLSNYNPELCGRTRINCPSPRSLLCNTLNCPADTFGCTVA